MPPKQARAEYIETEAGNKVSRRSHLHATTNIVLGGRTVIQSESIIRGDLLRTSSQTASTAAPTAPTANLAVSVGKYTFLSQASILHPPRKLHRGQFSHHPQKLGDNVFVGRGAIVEAATIGSNVWIGAGAVVGKLAILRDGAKVLDGSVVPPGMVIGAGEVAGGRPARIVGETGWGDGWEGREAWRGIG